jgi:O-antigen/teichoic acid export membrane protein
MLISTYASSNKRIAKNTLLLYFRQILIMLVSLYTVRIVLDVLGVEDFGIQNVVAGMVTMFSFLSSSMASASQRFFSFDIGRNREDKLRLTFSVTILIYLIISIIVFIVLETFGLWFLHTQMVIPKDRFVAASLVFHFSVLSFVFIILKVPFLSLVIAHEDMGVYAGTSIIEVVLKLVLVFLIKIIPIDKLVLYGVLLSFVDLINTIIYVVFCRIRYSECRLRINWDKALFFSILSFSGWSLFGNIANVLKNQGVNVLLNIYFGPVINASRGIAQRINSAVTSFSHNFVTAVRPQLIKLYAAGNSEAMMSLALKSSKYTSFLLSLFLLPLITETKSILSLWLGQVPNFSVAFTRLILVDALIKSMTEPMMTVIQATGKIKLYQILVGGTLLLNLPISALALWKGAPPEAVFIISIGLTILSSIFRLIIIKKHVMYRITDFLLHVFIPVFLVFTASLALHYILGIFLPSTFPLSVLTSVISLFMLVNLIYLVGMNNTERVTLRLGMSGFLKSLRKR